MNMKAVTFYAPGDIRYEEIIQPEAGPGEVVVEIKAALTCGTDLKTHRNSTIIEGPTHTMVVEGLEGGMNLYLYDNKNRKDYTELALIS